MAVFNFESSRKSILRNIYSSKNLNKYSLKKINEAQEELLKYKDSEFQSNHWKYPEVVSFLFGELKDNEQRSGDLRTIFAAVQIAHRIILMNDDTEKLEKLHLSLVEALHRWAFRYKGDLTLERNLRGDEMWQDIVEKANRLVECLNAYRNADSENGNEQEKVAKEV